jgi:hypothetical protein
VTAPDGTPAVADPAALQVALSYAARACACFQMGLPRLGHDALLSASEMAVVAFPAGSAGAVALTLVLDAVELVGDGAEFDAIDAGLGGAW